jgi:diguanylate cyclase|tara:strand:+ start:1344 stop:2987 length:1644 start_codon:yes stop_codon:yes gene_type:complete
MSRGRQQGRASTEAGLWKDKYRESLDRLEASEKRWSRRTGLLRQGLLSISGIAADTDQQLDRHLAELDAILKRDDMQGLAGLIEDIERDARRVETTGKRRADSLSHSLAKATGQLRPLSPNRKIEKQLTKLRVQLRAVDAYQHLPELTKKLAGLLREICTQLTDKPADQQESIGLWRKLLGGRPESSSSDRRGSDKDPNPVVAQEVKAVLYELVDRLPLEESEAAKRAEIMARLRGELKQTELTPVLKDIAEVVIAVVCRNEDDFESFLQILVNRLSDLQGLLTSVIKGQESSSRSRRSLTASVSQQLSRLGSIVRDADDVVSLKNTVQTQLDELTVIVDQFQAEEDGNKTLGDRLQELATSVVQMESEAVQSKQDLEQQRRKALTDPLTDMPNREAYQERLLTEEDNWLKNGGHLALAVGDIDLFKQVNDNYGHAAGDKVLRVIGQEITSHLRGSDFVARYGGEEFVVLLPGTSAEEALGVVDKIRKELQRCPFKFKGKAIEVTMSFGITEFKGGDRSDAVFERADAALYWAKENGRNRCQQYVSH